MRSLPDAVPIGHVRRGSALSALRQATCKRHTATCSCVTLDFTGSLPGRTTLPEARSIAQAHLRGEHTDAPVRIKKRRNASMSVPALFVRIGAFGCSPRGCARAMERASGRVVLSAKEPL